ncbi:MAG TPA: TetR family transcriptional regulator [Kofleriaceae bacterium]|nr:TetR family transcriptional regulator [Kofleriaceae bacterium]
MPRRTQAPISTRKQPQQARSTDLVAAILKAAIQVLEKEGAPRFTTARVAARAGVSVGSVYQYFPNKASILFRLQSEEWHETSEMLRAILEDASRPPLVRLRAAVHAFVKSECDEAMMRTALDDAAPLYRDSPEAKRLKAASANTLSAFMREVLPRASDKTRALATELIKTTMGQAGKVFSETARRPAEIVAYADAMSDMFSAYLRSLGAAR